MHAIAIVAIAVLRAAEGATALGTGHTGAFIYQM